MREIKFRAWDKKENRMTSLIDLGCDEYGSAWLNQSLDSLLSGRCVFSYELMQFTGLKDKNGVEIYEGDIIHNQRGNQVVQWVSEMCAWDMGMSGFVTDQEVGPYEPSEITVVGNVHENPDLVKSCKNIQ